MFEARPMRRLRDVAPGLRPRDDLAGAPPSPILRAFQKDPMPWA